MIRQKIIPHLWFDKEAVEAAEFYTSVFDDSKITHKSIIHDTPSGDCDIAGRPKFTFNEAISLIINCKYQVFSRTGKRMQKEQRSNMDSKVP